MRILWTLLASVGLVSAASAQSIEATGYGDYEIVTEMGDTLEGASREFNDVVYSITDYKAEMELMDEEVQAARDKYGSGSHDVVLLEERRRKKEKAALDELDTVMDKLMPRIAAADAESKRRIVEMLHEEQHYERLVDAYIHGDTTPETTALVIYLATARLLSGAAYVNTQIKLRNINIALEDIETALGLIREIDGAEPESLDLDTWFDKLDDPIDPYQPQREKTDLDVLLDGL